MFSTLGRSWVNSPDRSSNLIFLDLTVYKVLWGSFDSDLQVPGVSKAPGRLKAGLGQVVQTDCWELVLLNRGRLPGVQLMRPDVEFLFPITIPMKSLLIDHRIWIQGEQSAVTNPLTRSADPSLTFICFLFCEGYEAAESGRVGNWFACSADRQINQARTGCLKQRPAVHCGGWVLPPCHWHLLFRETIDCSSPLLFWESFLPQGCVRRRARGEVFC